MSTTPSPDTRAMCKVLHQVLEPRSPADADLRIVHAFLVEDPVHAGAAFHYWAAGIDPDAPDAVERMAQYLADPPHSRRSEHVYRVCTELARFAVYQEPEESEARQIACTDARLTYYIWAALTTPYPPRGVMHHCNQAARLDITRACAHPLFQFAMRRIAARTTEVQR